MLGPGAGTSGSCCVSQGVRVGLDWAGPRCPLSSYWDGDDGLGWVGRPSRPGGRGGYMSQVWELVPQSAPMGTPSQCPRLGPGDPAIHRATPAVLGQGRGIGRPLLSLASWMGGGGLVTVRRTVRVYMFDRLSVYIYILSMGVR